MICNAKRDLKDSNDNYLKSVCTVFIDFYYDTSVISCRDFGMKLFTARSDEEKNAINRYSDYTWPFGSFWIEGKSNTMCGVTTNKDRLNFETTEMGCYNVSYYYCEYACMYFFALFTIQS